MSKRRSKGTPAAAWFAGASFNGRPTKADRDKATDDTYGADPVPELTNPRPRPPGVEPSLPPDPHAAQKARIVAKHDLLRYFQNQGALSRPKT